MKRISNQRKGQLSLDLAFAVLMVLTVMAGVVDYWVDLQASVEETRVLMGLNVVADNAVAELNALYTSAPTSGHIIYKFHPPDDYLLGQLTGDERPYEIEYILNLGDNQLKVTWQEDSSIYVERTLGFKVEGNHCNQLSTNSRSADKLLFRECKRGSDELSCIKCQQI